MVELRTITVDFNICFKKVPRDEIVLPADEIPPVTSSDEEP